MHGNITHELSYTCSLVSILISNQPRGTRNSTTTDGRNYELDCVIASRPTLCLQSSHSSLEQAVKSFKSLPPTYKLPLATAGPSPARNLSFSPPEAPKYLLPSRIRNAPRYFSRCNLERLEYPLVTCSCCFSACLIFFMGPRGLLNGTCEIILPCDWNVWSNKYSFIASLLVVVFVEEDLDDD